MVLSTQDACAIARVTYRQLDYWTRIGLVEPIEPVIGTGHYRSFDEREVRVVFVIGRLAANSIPPTAPIARKTAAHVREHGLKGELRGKTGFLVVDLDQLNDPFDELDDELDDALSA